MTQWGQAGAGEGRGWGRACAARTHPDSPMRIGVRSMRAAADSLVLGLDSLWASSKMTAWLGGYEMWWGLGVVSRDKLAELRE